MIEFAAIAGFDSMSRHLFLVLLFVLQGPPAPTQNAGQTQGGRGGAAAAQNPKCFSCRVRFSGGAPDLGALEVGAAVPRYGPRP